MKKQFIAATTEACSFEKHIPAPCLRRSFPLDFTPTEAVLRIAGLGFYALFVNGREITKGPLAPYISNPDHYCYVDRYDLLPYLHQGENVIGVMLGNGFQNPFGGFIWDFHEAAWLGAPRVALELSATDGESTLTLEADEKFLTHPSPILFDEYRFYEIYDARRELGDWTSPGFAAEGWTPAIPVSAPRGELREVTAEPIRVVREIAPVKITPVEGGYLYDFGVNTAGITRLCLKDAAVGQRIAISHGEMLVDGRLNCNNIKFMRPSAKEYHKMNYTDVYFAKGEAEERYAPRFVYHGFRYAFVEGLTEKQATPEALTYLEMHSDLAEIGDFCCSDPMANALFAMVKRSDLSNFYYFPTDCPHREKNGWTGDASMSADHMVLLYDVQKSYREWLSCIRKSQREDGALPGIVPTGGWGFEWGNGPAWDSVLFNLPYVLFRYRGDTEVVKENAHAMLRYLDYILTRRSADGTVAVGLGDWVPTGKRKAEDFDAPLALTDSLMVMDMAKKAAEMLGALAGFERQAEFAAAVAADMKAALRENLLDKETMTVAGSCQSSQALAIYYDMLEEEEKPAAVARLLEFIHQKGDSFDCGFLGLHAIFHVLGDFGEQELAYRMITKKDYPSYGYLVEHGETTLVEWFRPYDVGLGSRNHHFMGDIGRWFITSLAGLKPLGTSEVEVCPHPVASVDFASAHVDLPAGRVSVEWRREGDRITVRADAPQGITLTYRLPEGCKLS